MATQMMEELIVLIWLLFHAFQANSNIAEARNQMRVAMHKQISC